MSDRYLFSIDGGGTKTAFCIYNLSDSSRQYYYSGSSNYRSTGEKTAQRNIVRTFEWICRKANISKEQIVGCVFGLSGYDTSKDYQVYENMFKALDIDESKIYVCNDSELVFYSSIKAPGIALVCGTGSIAFGINSYGEKARAGGWGNNISDFGSGYWIGLHAIQRLLQHYDGCGTDEAIFEEIKKLYRISSEENVPSVISGLNHYEIAACAKLVAEFAEKGDDFCKNIISGAIEHLCTLIHLVYCKLNFQEEEMISVALGGSLFKNSYFRSQVEERLRMVYHLRNVQFYPAASNSIDGGINIAMDKFIKNL